MSMSRADDKLTWCVLVLVLTRSSTGAVDTTVCTNLNTAKSLGIPYRDVYMFPCPTCSASAASQMSQLTSYLNSNCASAFSGRVWLDIEGSQYWYSSTSTNKGWYEDLVDSCKTYGVQCGVYSSSSQWSSIFGSSSYSYGASESTLLICVLCTMYSVLCAV